MKPIIAIPAWLAIVYRAWSRKSLTPLGLFTAGATAIAHAVHPWSVFFVLLAVFFLAGTAVTKVKHDIKAKLTQSATGVSGGEGPRNHVQVLANSVVATALILLHTWQIYDDGSYSKSNLCWPRGSHVLVVGIVANYAAVASDTFSSELGILSKTKPRLITAPWRVVPPGTNGGVTLAGLAAGLLGSFIIAATSTLMIPFCKDWNLQEKAQFTGAMTFAGFCGTLLDSYLGAVFQASVVDVHSGKIVEGEGGRKVLIHRSSPLHLKQTAKLRSEVVGHEDSKEGIAKTSGFSDSTKASNRMREAGVSGAAFTDRHHESRHIEVGHDILDNNGVNLLMAVLIGASNFPQTASSTSCQLTSNSEVNMSLRFVPPANHPTHSTPENSAPSAPGVHDTLRSRLALSSAPITSTTTASSSNHPIQLQSAHPLEARLVQWRQTQDKLKMEMLRRQFGIAEPVRRGMEIKITGAGEWRPMVLGGASGVHRDILEGRDCEVGWEDVFVGNELREVPDFHTEMETRMKMNW
ncbi:UMP1-domain-containing protein [Lindgomyces ingoldianus]|uniref:UMP1-domain-containing protein n=1 Tax=Lindgomyces ingoldianus TaxID=673940 RepID=A0ACB6R1M3_9PLEO|nr:UMP1-domain-containing protein [Lindgomyces ingoldianus]KAF2472237.1 UMP1-domain-containing protein [Lindgomyces ingoldianus]